MRMSQTKSMNRVDKRGARGGPAAVSNKRDHTQPAARIHHNNLKRELADNILCAIILLHLTPSAIVWDSAFPFCSRVPGARQVMVLSMISQANVAEAGKCAGSACRQEQP